MRTFEVVLIIMNLLSLFLWIKKQSTAVWVGEAGANLAVFLIHGIFEGFRYQMIFSYIFVVLLVGYSLLKMKHKFFQGVNISKTIKVAVLSLSFIFIGLTSFLAYAFPVFTLPKPTGAYGVGIKYFHLVDKKRNEPFLDKSTKKRELMVKVYYPAKKDDLSANVKPLVRYFHNSPELIKSFTAFFNLPDFIFDHLNLVKTNSKEDLPLSNNAPSYPVVLFSHGAGSSMEVQTSQCEDLASHGYIVAAIDHTYVSAATAFPDRIVTAKEATTNFNTAEPVEIITQIMADDSKFVIDKLVEMNEGKMDPIFKGKFNLDRIGAIGHSVGGAVAYNLAINDHRVKAAINLDGRVFTTPLENSRNIAPFLMLANDQGHIQSIQNRESLLRKFETMPVEEQKNMLSMYGSKEAYNEAYSKAQQNMIGLVDVIIASGNLYTIEGSDHMKFTDIGLFFGIKRLRELIGISGRTAPAKCLEITKSITLAFFDQQLKGKTRNSLESLVKKYSELKKIDLK